MRRERLRPVVRLLSAFAAVLCPPACITGSAGNGSVSGTASVTSTGKMEGIRVLIPELRRTATTGPDGKFRIADVPPGSYLVVAEDNAYLWQDRKSAIVSGGAETSLAFSLSFDGAVGTVVGAVPRIPSLGCIAPCKAKDACCRPTGPSTTPATLSIGREACLRRACKRGICGFTRSRSRGRPFSGASGAPRPGNSSFTG